MTNFIQGLILESDYVMPIGAQNIFMINTALKQSKTRILLTSLVIFLFDISLAISCFYGIGAILETALWLKLVVLFLGSLIVMWIGFSILKDKSITIDNNTNVDIPITRVISSAFVVTWLNPQALIDGSLMLGAFRVSLPGFDGTLFIIGVCVASLIWWFGLSTFVSFFKTKITYKAMRVINVFCGSILIFYGLKLFSDFLRTIAPLIK